MQNSKSRLIIHTSIAPDAEAPKSKPQDGRVAWRVLPHPLKRERPQRAARRTRPVKTPRVRQKRAMGERLLRNTAIACALLMAVTVLSRIDTPWTNQIAQTVSSAVTMRINLDETLGRLNFVRNWMPDAALVFWNMDAQDALARPVAGALTHAFDAGQPWIEYQVSGEQPVYAAADGLVAAISENANGEWTLMIDHERGEQTIYAYLGKVIVKVGQQIERGAQVAVTRDQTAAKLYFELRIGGVPADPSSRLKGA